MIKVIGVVLAFVVVAALAGPVIDDSKDHIDNSVHAPKPPTVEESLMKKLNSKCSNRDISSCMMLKLVTYFNRMLKKHSIEFGDVEILKTSAEAAPAEAARSLGAGDMSEEAQMSQLITDKIYSFIKTRSLKWKVADGLDVVVSGSEDKDGGLGLGISLRPGAADEARKKKGGGNNMGTMMAAAMMKIGILKALAFKALVFLVGKALLVSKLALVLAAVIGLKKLLSSEKHVTYEVVASHGDPHHSGGGGDSYGGGGGGGGHGWGRSLEPAQHLAYSAHVPQN